MIDWFTVGAQIINFLILVGLLKYFLYERVLAAIDDRNKEIEKRQLESKRKLLEVGVELKNAKNKNLQIEQEKEKKHEEIRKEVDDYYRQQKVQVRNEMDALRKQWAESIQQEQESFLNDLKKRSIGSVWEISRMVLDDLADVGLERQIVSRFVRLLKSLPSSDREDLARTLSQSDQIAVVQSKFELPDDVRSTIKNAIQDELMTKSEIRFETVDDLECGIALQTNSHKFSWNLRDHLTKLQNDFVAILNEQTRNTTAKSSSQLDSVNNE